MSDSDDIATWDRLLSEQTALFRKTASENAELRTKADDAQRELSVWKTALKAREDEIEALKKDVSRLERNVESLRDDHPLILCVIDGDGNIFSPELIRDGHAGGKQAAQILTKGLTDHLASIADTSAARGRLWVSVYCNKSGLSDTLAANHLCTPEQFEAFILGFNQASPLFSIVDVGAGKEAADAKIKEYLRVFAPYPQTAQVILGGSHDGGYTTTLNALESEGLLNKVTILRGYDTLARELQTFKLPVIDIEGLFIEKKLPARNGKTTITVADIESLFTPKEPQARNGKVPIGTSLASQTDLPEAPIATHSLSSKSKAKQPWGASPVKSESNTLAGQRYLDPTIPMDKHDPPPCKLFYLTQCDAGPRCRYGHSYILSPQNLTELREVAKKTPCPRINRNNQCQDGDNCIFAHFCPRGKTCSLAKRSRCKFSGKNMHDLEAPKGGNRQTTPTLNSNKDPKNPNSRTPSQSVSSFSSPRSTISDLPPPPSLIQSPTHPTFPIHPQPPPTAPFGAFSPPLGSAQNQYPFLPQGPSSYSGPPQGPY